MVELQTNEAQSEPWTNKLNTLNSYWNRIIKSLKLCRHFAKVLISFPKWTVDILMIGPLFEEDHNRFTSVPFNLQGVSKKRDKGSADSFVTRFSRLRPLLKSIFYNFWFDETNFRLIRHESSGVLWVNDSAVSSLFVHFFLYSADLLASVLRQFLYVIKITF